MGVVFLILKIIGIILLVIAAIVAVILFVPIIYEADGDSRKKNAHIKVGWLFGLLRFFFRYEDGSSDWKLHLLWFQPFPRDGTSEKRGKKQKRKGRRHSEEDKGGTFHEREENRFSEEEGDHGEKAENGGQESSVIIQGSSLEEDLNAKDSDPVIRSDPEETGAGVESEKTEQTSLYKGPSIHVSPPPAESENNEGTTEEKKRSGVFRKPGRRLLHSSGKKKRTWKKKKHTAKAGHGHRREEGTAVFLRRAWNLFQKYRERELFSRLFRALMKLLLRIRPRAMKGNVQFGFSDPSLTGRVLGAAAMVPFLYSMDLQVDPDFETEKAYFQGDIYLKGRVQLVFVLVFVLRLLLNKDFRQFLSQVKKLR